MSQAELQDALLRFEGRLSGRLHEAFAPLRSASDAELRVRAARDHLLYESAALDIVTGPVPESNLLDMVAFVELALETCRSRWSVDVHGERGAAILGALDAARVDVWSIAGTLLDEEQKEELRTIIHEWREENPGVELVAAVRLPFSGEAGRAASRVDEGARGLFASVRRGVAAADMARLLGERALFLAQRMPFLIRLHVTIAADEIAQRVGGEMPTRAGEVASSAASAMERHVRRAIAMAAVAAAGVVVVGVLAYRATSR